MKLKCLPISRLVGYRGLEPRPVGLQSTALPVKLTTRMVPRIGLEPMTYRLEGGCSFQLS